MALIIEDGSVVTGANSYVTLADIRAYALARGVTLSADDPTLEVDVVKAMDYLLSLEQQGQYVGYRTSDAQALSFPREDVYLYGFEVPNNSIPQSMIDAECRLVMYIGAGVDPFASKYDGTAPIKRKKTDVLETEYDTETHAANRNTSSIPEVDKILSPVLRKGGALKSVRV